MTRWHRLVVVVALLLAAQTRATTTTFSIAASGDDGIVAATGSPYASIGPTYASTSDGAQPLSRSTGFQIYQLFFRWNTAATIPANATINSAQFVVDDTFAVPTSADALSIACDWYTWSPSLDGADWVRTAPNTALTGTLITSIPSSTSATVGSLTNLSNISTMAGVYTELRCSVTQRAADAAPTGTNSLWVYFVDAGGGHDVPRLVVDWSVSPCQPPCTAPLVCCNDTVGDGKCH